MKDELLPYREYFLGKLSRAESQKIDEATMSRDEVDPKMIEAEQALIEEYLDGELSPDDHALFEKNFLVSKRRREELEDIRLLRKLARESELALGAANEIAAGAVANEADRSMINFLISHLRG